jgi:hypothetical protein
MDLHRRQEGLRFLAGERVDLWLDPAVLTEPPDLVQGRVAVEQAILDGCAEK